MDKCEYLKKWCADRGDDLESIPEYVEELEGKLKRATIREKAYQREICERAAEGLSDPETEKLVYASQKGYTCY